MAGMKGHGLGATTFEDPSGVDLVDRKEIGFFCPDNHEFHVTFSAEAELPTIWECPKCGLDGHRLDGVEPELKPEKPVRTHWDMLTERRTIPELEELLAERLAEIRSERY